jgi:hypothetical protein
LNANLKNYIFKGENSIKVSMPQMNITNFVYKNSPQTLINKNHHQNIQNYTDQTNYYNTYNNNNNNNNFNNINYLNNIRENLAFYGNLPNMPSSIVNSRAILNFNQKKKLSKKI